MHLMKDIWHIDISPSVNFTWIEYTFSADIVECW